jgi:hypothetical protein
LRREGLCINRPWRHAPVAESSRTSLSRSTIFVQSHAFTILATSDRGRKRCPAAETVEHGSVRHPGTRR